MSKRKKPNKRPVRGRKSKRRRVAKRLAVSPFKVKETEKTRTKSVIHQTLSTPIIEMQGRCNSDGRRLVELQALIMWMKKEIYPNLEKLVANDDQIRMPNRVWIDGTEYKPRIINNFKEKNQRWKSVSFSKWSIVLEEEK